MPRRKAPLLKYATVHNPETHLNCEPHQLLLHACTQTMKWKVTHMCYDVTENDRADVTGLFSKSLLDKRHAVLKSTI